LFFSHLGFLSPGFTAIRILKGESSEIQEGKMVSIHRYFLDDPLKVFSMPTIGHDLVIFK
jgi:hypothetical protein